MQLPKIDVQPTRLAQLLNDMQSGRLQIPRFQRDFVWPLSKTRALLDSMYKEFPIGTFFLWRAPVDAPSLIRPLASLDIPAPPPGERVAYILDGQQRLTSLFMAINGKNIIGSGNYGRISIDLDTATRYEENNQEDFNEDIFVYRSPDNQRYVAVKDLTGNTHVVYDTIPQEYRGAFNKVTQLFQTYPFSVVWIQEQSLGDAIEIFQRINQAGQRLSRYDLVCANVWSKDFDFRKRVKLFNEKLQADGFGALHETIFTQTFAMILKNGCTTVDELSLKTEEIVAIWDKGVRAIQLAIDFSANNMGVKRADFLPYRGLMVVLAYYFYHAPKSNLAVQERNVLWNWFWQVTLSERYSSTSPTRMAEDAAVLKRMIDGEEVSFSYSAKASPEAVRRTKMSSTSSTLRNACLCMLALKEPRNLRDNSLVNLRADFFSNLKKAERHHIFSVGYLRKHGDAGQIHLIPNFCFIPADLNQEIGGSRPPSDFLAEFKAENPHFDGSAQTHMLPVSDDAAVWQDDFTAFIDERARLIAQGLNDLLKFTPDEFIISDDMSTDEESTAIDLLEVRIRDFIDHRLTAAVGPNYWRRTIPEKVRGSVNEIITQRLKRFPYEDRMKYGVPRQRLNFCFISHYFEIFRHNWILFEEVFKHKEALESHMHNYGALRNVLHHNNEPSDVERKLGEAAIIWLNDTLRNYEQQMEEEEQQEEDDNDVMDDEA